MSEARTVPRLSRDEVQEQVIDFIARQFELDHERVRPEARFFDDLGLDSIDAVELALHLSEVTDQAIDESTLRSIVTVGDVIDLTVRLTARPAGPGSGTVG